MWPPLCASVFYVLVSCVAYFMLVSLLFLEHRKLCLVYNTNRKCQCVTLPIRATKKTGTGCHRFFFF